MSNDKVRKFFFPSEDDGVDEQLKTDTKIATNSDLYHHAAEESITNKLYNVQNQFTYSFKGHTNILSSVYYDENGNLKTS